MVVKRSGSAASHWQRKQHREPVLSAPAICVGVLSSALCRALAQGFAQARVSFTAARTGCWGEGIVRNRTFRCFPASWLCSAPSKQKGCCGFLSWAMAQLCSRMLFTANRLCCHFNSQVCSHNTHMLSTLLTYRKHPFLDDWIYQALLWYSGHLQPMLSPAMHKWSSCFLPLPKLTLSFLCLSVLCFQSTTTALSLKEHKRYIYKASFLEGGSLLNLELQTCR